MAEAKNEQAKEKRAKAKPAKDREAKAQQAGERGSTEGRAEPQPAIDLADYVPRLKTYYTEVVRPRLIERFGYKNPMEVPRLDKVVLNMGVGEATADSKKVQSALADLAKIAGQKPAISKARKSIATFKLREGQAIGGHVTLRQLRMYEFVDRLVNIALPRVRDFRGLNPKSFDGRGNFAMGIKEHIIFPEINYDEVDQIWGMDVIVCTTARSDDEARALLRELNFPFRQ